MRDAFIYEQLQGATSGAVILASCLDVVALVSDPATIKTAAADVKAVREARALSTGIVLLAKGVTHNMTFVEVNRLARDLVSVREAATDDSHNEARGILQNYWACAYRAHGNPATYIKKLRPATAHP